MVCRCRLCLFAVSIFYAVAFAQDLTPELRAQVDQRIHLQRAFDGRANSSGAELQAVQLMRAPVGKDVHVFAFELRAKGLPTELDYELLMLPTMAGSIRELHSSGSVQIDKTDGRIIDGPGDPRTLILPDPAPGEPYRFVLVSDGAKYKAYVSVVPKPIEARDNTCKVSIVRLMPHFELAFIQATGFPPESEIAVRGNSEGEVHDFKIKINADGRGDVSVLPAKLGKSKGKMEMQFTSPKCSPKVSFKWGSTEQGQPYQ